MQYLGLNVIFTHFFLCKAVHVKTLLDVPHQGKMSSQLVRSLQSLIIVKMLEDERPCPQKLVSCSLSGNCGDGSKREHFFEFSSMHLYTLLQYWSILSQRSWTCLVHLLRSLRKRSSSLATSMVLYVLIKNSISSRKRPSYPKCQRYCL